MKSATGRWVSGDDFFDRERELQILETRVRDGNHVLLTGQRRMGKSSIVQELGRRLLRDKDWIFLSADVQDAGDEEDAIADIAKAVHPVRPIASRFASKMGRWFNDRVEEVNAVEFRVKIRAGLNARSWRHYGEQLLRDCATQDKPVLLAIDELPIFLKKMLDYDDGARRVDGFLSWLRGVLQSIGNSSLILIISGSIGLEPLVKRLGIPDRINHLFPFRLGPWDRNTSIACFEKLAASYELRVEEGVAGAVYDALGVGIPHQVQSFFVQLRDDAIMQERKHVTVEDVKRIYSTALLGPSGQNDLMHYETRLKEGMEEETYVLAMEIIAEAATQGVFTAGAQRSLERLYSAVVGDAAERITDALDILVHDGYLEADTEGYHFPAHLLKDSWEARFRNHHTPLESR